MVCFRVFAHLVTADNSNSVDAVSNALGPHFRHKYLVSLSDMLMKPFGVLLATRDIW